LRIFLKSIEKIKVSLKSETNEGHFTWRRMNIYDNISPDSSNNEKYFRQICREIRNIYFLLHNLFFKSCQLWDDVKKCCSAGQATDDNMAHAHRMLD